MFTLLLRLRRRIRKLFKVQTESRQRLTSSFRSKSAKILILLATSVGIGVLYPGEILYDPLDMPRRGEFAREDIVAPFQITILKSDRDLLEEQDEIRQYTFHVLDADTGMATTAVDRLKSFFQVVDSLKLAHRRPTTEVFRQMVDSVASRFPMLSQGAIERALSDTVASGRVRDALQDIYVNQIYAVGVLNQMSELPISPHTTVLVRAGDKESVYDRNRILDIALANARLLTALNQLAATQPIDVDFCYNIGRHFILPNLWVDMAEYNRRVKEGLQQLTTVKEVVSTGDVIVSARQKVTDRQEEILQEMAQMLRADAARRGWWMAILPVVARVVLVLAVFSSLYFFLRLFRREVYRSNPKLLALFLVFAVQMFLLYFVDLLGLKTIYIYPVAVLPIMVTILFDAEIGILSTLILAILLGILHRFSFSLALLVTAVGFVGCMTSRRVRKRSDFYRIMLSSALAYVLLILIVENLKLTPSGEVLTEMGFGLIISILSVMAIMVLLPVFESMFGLTTDTTLLELSDLNHPLLKRLSIEAPGTYHHSISVGNLCETAAEAIGANSLLARVGAYYHDIGKIEVPEYFVENQFSVKSRHDALTPSMSALILSSHVKKGRLLGEEADIPDDVLNFIEEHHGTMVMSYFYHRAKQVEGDDANIDKYRYPGPKPQTRETGIAMLADAVEAASRTLDDPKPARIDALIQKIINDRFQSGELDQCPLTLRDLAKIKQAFAQVLIAAFHHRVKYPAERGE